MYQGALQTFGSSIFLLLLLLFSLSLSHKHTFLTLFFHSYNNHVIAPLFILFFYYKAFYIYAFFNFLFFISLLPVRKKN